MHLPNWEGFTQDNFEDPFDRLRVIVDYVIDDPTLPGKKTPYSPQESYKTLRDAGSLNLASEKIEHGLRCFDRNYGSAGVLFCLPINALEDQEEEVSLDVHPDKAGPYPEFIARYTSKRYGGVQINWRTNIQNLSMWREIDKKIWENIDAWNIAGK
jgi:hypothetical protein